MHSYNQKLREVDFVCQAGERLSASCKSPRYFSHGYRNITNLAYTSLVKSLNYRFRSYLAPQP